MTKYFGKTDNQGNELELEVTFDKSGKKSTAKIYLILARERPRKRMLGLYVYDECCLYVNRQSDKHYHRKMKGYGFNYDLLRSPDLPVKKIVLTIDDNERYVFPATMFKDWGRYLNFKEQGFELQCFLQIDLIMKYSETTKYSNHE